MKPLSLSGAENSEVGRRKLVGFLINVQGRETFHTVTANWDCGSMVELAASGRKLEHPPLGELRNPHCTPQRRHRHPTDRY